MTPPNSDAYNPDPNYLRALIANAGVSQTEAARLLGVGARTMRYYLQFDDKYKAPYTVQYALEMLAQHRKNLSR